MKPWLGEVLTYGEAEDIVAERTLLEVPVLCLGMSQLTIPIVCGLINRSEGKSGKNAGKFYCCIPKVSTRFVW
jgi:hypothetical protein